MAASKVSSGNLRAWDVLAPTHESTISLDCLASTLDWPRRASILDVGCGYGRVLSHLEALGFTNACGIDGSPEMVKRARRAGLRTLVGNATALPFPDAAFECVICIGTLSSIALRKDRVAALREMRRVISATGKVLLADFLITYTRQRLSRYINHGMKLRRWGNFVSPEGIEFHHFHLREVRQSLSDASIDIISKKILTVRTMHGNRSKAFTVVGTPL